jgi:lysyl-tRNA synthetase class 2
MTTPPIEENDQTRARRDHLEAIRELVGNAYPNRFARTNVAGSAEGEDTITAVVRRFKGHAPQAEPGARPTPEQLEEANAKLREAGAVRVSGRVATPPRVMGKAAFVHLSDGRERLQIYVRRQDAAALSNDSGQPVEQAESGWSLFQLLDHGDFVGVEGFVFVTKSGELSVHVEKIQFLSKALLPMPDKLHGINDPEIRQRQRYADLIASSLKVEKDDEQGETAAHELTTREVFERRSMLIRELRRYLDDHGYIEVETPMLSPLASGAAARPFRTHHNALDIDLYLRIAPELYLKRLIAGGFERVYELNRNFRNEGISTRHNPEFTMLEFYTAYQDLYWMMDFSEEMLRTVIKSVSGSTVALFEGEAIDFGRKFERLSMKQAIGKFWTPQLRRDVSVEFDVNRLDYPSEVSYLAEWAGEWASHGEATPAETEDGFGPQRANLATDFRARAERFESLKDSLTRGDEEDAAKNIAYIFETVAEHHLIQPTFITDFPKAISPLCKASPDDPAVAERFELYVAGMECANAFSELNDPVEQYQRFEEQTRQRERGDDEAMQMDLDYVRALSYGMPPTAGNGIGIDRLTMILTNRRSIRDVILFPHMRPQRHAPEAAENAGDEDAPGGGPDA